MNSPSQSKTLFRSFRNSLVRVSTSNRRSSLRTRFLLMIYLISLGSISVVGYFGYNNATKALLSKASELVSSNTTDTANKMQTFQETVFYDMIFLSTSRSLFKSLYWSDIGDEIKSRNWLILAADLTQQFLSAYTYDYKICFIDKGGDERFCAKRPQNTDMVKLLPKEALQNDQERDYFIQAMKLAKGEMFASAIAPNIEQGLVEKPMVPVVSISTPVIGANNVRYGVMVAYVFADSYFKYAREANDLNNNRKFFVINDKGDYLFHYDQNKAFAQIVSHDSNFDLDFPGLLNTVKQVEKPQTLTKNGSLLSFQHIHLNAGRHENGFILVGCTAESIALAELSSFIELYLLLIITVILAVVLVANYFISGLIKPLEFVTRQLQRLGRGETNRDNIEYSGNDEISRMLDSSRKLMANMESLATKADIISQGDFSGDVPLLSDLDRLGIAINNMIHMLRQTREKEEHSNWLKDGITQLNESLTGNLTPQQLANMSMSIIGRKLEAGRGVFYRYQKNAQALTLLGSYMFIEREALNNHFKLGEGAVGQSALEKKPIILHTTDDTAPIVTGTLSHPPGHIYTFPLLREGELQGVIELAAFERFDGQKLEFLNRAAEVIASFFFIVEQHEQIKGLLKSSENATLQAQEQSHRLQETNTLMEEQQQQLQQQSEELQQTNSQLEEQQQQMIQQAIDLEQKNRDINQSRDELFQRANELELAGKYKSEFLANMSHELRTPLNSIILLSKMLAMNEEKHLTVEEVKRASIVHRSGEELLRLINDILDLSKIEAGKMELHLRSIATSDLAEELRDYFTATALEKDLEFIVDDQIQNSFVSDTDKLSQILRNLLSNAFKFTKQGNVTLRIHNSGKTDLPLSFTVIDTGIGIPQDKQSLIFEAFQQEDGSISREYGGTGLGLTISKRIAELLGGNIELRSTLGEGSEFSLTLPLSVEPKHNTPTIAPPPSKSPLSSAPRSKQIELPCNDDRHHLSPSDQVILLIDDDVGFGMALMALNKQQGYKTLLATSGQEGLRMARTYHPRGILLDLGLPDMDGLEVLHNLKSDSRLSHIAVCIVSSRDKTDNLLHESIIGYLQKPVDESQLAELEANVMAQAKHKSSLLLLEGTSLPREELEKIAQQEALTIKVVHDLQTALDMLSNDSFGIALIDLARKQGQEKGLDICRAMREVAPDLQLILYNETPLDAEEDAALRLYTDCIIIKAAQAKHRMQENIKRFLQNMSSGKKNHLTLTPITQDNAKKLEGRHILVIDDNPRNLFVITSALEQHGAKVGNALSGAKGLEYIRQHGADLIFMDIMMPEMDGFETIKEVRKDPFMLHIPVVALTAKAHKSDREKALQSGADDYLSKPVDYEVLVNMAKIWCEGKR